MKKTRSIILLGALVAMLSNLSTLAQDIKYYNLDDTKIALRGYSPVSYFEVGKPQKGKKEFKSTYQGIHYYFTSAAQKKTFESNPSRYVPAYGGWCAFGVSVGGLFRIDPKKYKIVDDRLFVFLNNIEVDALALWNDTPNADVDLTKKANVNWEKFKVGKRPKTNQ